jgi:hypothetical protein
VVVAVEAGQYALDIDNTCENEIPTEKIFNTSTKMFIL